MIRITYLRPGTTAGSANVDSSESVKPWADEPTSSLSPTELPSPLLSTKIFMSQSLTGVAHSMRTLTLALSTPAVDGTVNAWSFQQVSSSVSKSAHGTVVAGPPEKLCAGLGLPRAGRPLGLATIGR